MFAALKKLRLPTFGQIAQEYLASMHNRAAYVQIRSILRKLDRLNNIRADKVTRGDIEAVIAQAEAQGASAATINHIVTYIGTIYRRARERGLDLKIPSEGVRKKKVNNARQGFLTPAECRLLLDEIAAAGAKNQSLYIFTLLLIATGARVGTVVLIRGVDVDLNKGAIRLQNHKVDRGYDAYIGDELRGALVKALKALPNPYCYVIGARDKPMHKFSLSQRLRERFLDPLFNAPRKIDRRDRRNKIVAHSLRHSFGSNLAMAGVSPYAIQALLDHSSPAMTARYVKFADVSKREAINAFMRSIATAETKNPKRPKLKRRQNANQHH